MRMSVLRRASRIFKLAALGALLAAPAARAEVALVLSGGGAAGAAHVGVIRALEEAGIYADCVAGTSMGAIVGGLYASGMSVDRMEEEVRNIDWFSILDDASDRAVVHPLRRQPRTDTRSLLGTVPIGAGQDGGVRADAGLIDGNRLLLELRRLTLDVAGINDFDDFERPYRAVATNLATGKETVLGDGDLALAMRASMSLPGLFPPVVLNDEVLVDGGVANNLPISVGDELCAAGENDTVIAVTIPQSDPDIEGLTTFTGALGQTLSLLIRSSTNQQLQLDIGPREVLEPAVNDIGTVDFPKVPEAMKIGYESTKAQALEIAERIAEREDLDRAAIASGAEAASAPRSAKQRGQNIEVTAVKVEDNTKYSNQVILAYLDITPPTSISALELSQRLERLYGLGAFDLVTYRVEADGTLVIITRERAAGPIEFRVGGAFEDSFDGRVRAVAGGGVGFTQLNPLGLRVDLDFAIGTDQFAAARVEQPLDEEQRWFAIGEGVFSAFNGPVFDDPEERVAEYRLRTATLGADLGYAPTDTVLLRAGPMFRLRRATLETGDFSVLANRSKSEAIGTRFALNIDTLDDDVLPSSGFSLTGDVFFEGEPLASGDVAGTFQLDALAAFDTGYGLVHGFVRGAADIGDSSEILGFNSIGGFQRLSGFERNAVVGDVAGVVGLRGVASVPLVQTLSGLRGFAGASFEYGGAWDGLKDIGPDQRAFAAGSVFAGVRTRLGPFYLGYGHAETGVGAVYLGFGEKF